MYVTVFLQQVIKINQPSNIIIRMQLIEIRKKSYHNLFKYVMIILKGPVVKK